MSPYLFVIASALGVLPILIIFKISMERIKEEPKNARTAQLHFMLGATLSDIIPIIIIIYSFTNIAPVKEIDELYLPGIIILTLVGISAFFILLQRIVDVSEEIKPIVTSFTSISLALMASVPIISIVGLVMMIP